METKHQLIVNEIVQATEEKRFNIHNIMDIHQSIKNSVSLDDNKIETIAGIWSQCGMYLEDVGEDRMAELCHFMSNLYHKSNPVYIDNLICIYVRNKKYKFAIEFLQKLYHIITEETNTIFWNRLINILPKEELIQLLTKPKASLEEVLFFYELSPEDPLVWMVLGYTIKTLDRIPSHLILSNQALDNALALKYLN